MSESRVIEQAVLRKKIIMQCYLDTILSKSRLIRYAHIVFTIGSPILGFIRQMTTDPATQTASIYVGVIAAGLSRLPDILHIGKITTTLKAQLKLYDTLYGKIILRRRTNDNSNIYHLAKEYSFIESNDIDVPSFVMKKIETMYTEYGIVVESPIQQLKQLNFTPEIVNALAQRNNIDVNPSQMSNASVSDVPVADVPNDSTAQREKTNAIERLKNLQVELNENSSLV
jgi:hypothetical protein